MKRSYMTAILFILVLAFGLTACGGAKNNKENASGQTSESGTSLSAEPEDAKEAADLYQELMQKEEDIQSANAKLWEKLFLTIDKDQVVNEDNNNYGDFLLKAIEAAKDQFTADELKILNDGAGQIREIEEKLMALEEKYPDCVKMPGEGESAAAGNAELAGAAGSPGGNSQNAGAQAARSQRAITAANAEGQRNKAALGAG
ncbi:hypothetical protein [uncultured Phascolarctobacterium sp.]|uniref:hypothetical protein n=1 Tax=uncultured Phascolarctobacterium sp. TaxID=512296 RepID=UPI0025CE1C39|nr:hypothetical protein [uncultured Phascolarctobacterium sp.]